MANHRTGKNRKNVSIYLSEECRIIYKDLVKRGVRMSLKIEELIKKLNKN